MKTVLILLAVGFLGHAARMQTPVTSVYVPSGFDAGSDAFIVASGLFPNGCYSWEGAEVKSENHLHTVKVFAKVSEPPCLKVLIPFTEEIALGQLEAGEHTVRFPNYDGTYADWKLNID